MIRPWEGGGGVRPSGKPEPVACKFQPSVCSALLLLDFAAVISDSDPHHSSGAGIMEADDRQVTVFTVQPSLRHRHSTNRVS